MGGEVKPGSRGLKSWAQRHLNVGFAVGFLLVLLTYLVVSRQLAVTAPGAVITKAPRVADKQVIVGAAGDDAVSCVQSTIRPPNPIGHRTAAAVRDSPATARDLLEMKDAGVSGEDGRPPDSSAGTLWGPHNRAQSMMGPTIAATMVPMTVAPMLPTNTHRTIGNGSPSSEA